MTVTRRVRFIQLIRAVWTIQDESIDQPTMVGHVDEEGER